MRNVKVLVLGLFVAGSALAAGCAYGGIAAVDNNTVVITRNDGFLFGALRKVYVCQVSDAGLTACADRVAP